MYQLVNCFAVVLVLLSLDTTGGVAAAADPCRPLNELIGIDRNSFLRAFSGDDSYFCAATAPTQFQCSCGASASCGEFLDPWGRDIGRCGCCPDWLYILFAIFGVFLLIAILFFVYGCCMRGKWWCDGYPLPVRVLLPKRGPAVVAAAGQRLPQNLFRGYRSEDFVDEHQQQQQLAAAAAAPSETSRRSTQRRIIAAPARTPTTPTPPTPSQQSSSSPAQPNLTPEAINTRPTPPTVAPSPTPLSNISPQLHMGGVLRSGSFSQTESMPGVAVSTNSVRSSLDMGSQQAGGVGLVLSRPTSGSNHSAEQRTRALAQSELDLL